MNLSFLMLKMGRTYEAVQWARECVEILEKVFPAPHPRKVEAYITLVYSFSKHGIYNDSLVYYSEKSYFRCSKNYMALEMNWLLKYGMPVVWDF